MLFPYIYMEIVLILFGILILLLLILLSYLIEKKIKTERYIKKILEKDNKHLENQIDSTLEKIKANISN